MTPLGQRLIEYDYGESHRNEIMRRTWGMTPFVLNVNTDSIGRGRRYRDMMLWCRDNLGESAWPFGTPPREGNWQFGGATIHGWTHVGFKTREHMDMFKNCFHGMFEDE
jgi:hypothetical protein